MNARYSRLASGEEGVRINYLKWAQTKLPTVFLRQQLMLVGLTITSLLLLLFTTFFTSDIDYDLPRNFVSSDMNFGVVVDCGSSGTRAHIFEWHQDDSKMHSIELLRDRITQKPLNKHITPGLSSLQAEPDKASDYMEPIMNFISESIPVERHLDTPIYFMATAGLRLLDKSIQKKLLSDLTRDLRVKFNFPKIKSQVISGENEGVYSWLSLNRKRIFTGEETSNNNNDTATKSFGMIEMGGASTQVAFELDPEVESAIVQDLGDSDTVEAFKREHITLNLSQNKSIKLFASTFLGLGVNSARESAIDLLVRDYLKGTGGLGSKHEKNFEVRLQDPCLTTGSSEIVLRPTELITSTQQSIGFVIKQQEDTFKVRLEGSGNFLNCLTLLERVLQIVKTERLNCPSSTMQQAKQTCPIVLLGNNFIPFKYQSFVGLSEMFFTTNEMVNAAGRFNRTKVLHETNRICSTEYNKLLEMYSNNGVSFEDRILYECFKSSWLLTIIHNSGFKMPTTYENFVTAEKLDGHEIDWTIGAMLSQVALNKILISS